MTLNHRDYGGEGPPIVILHGLFGSSKNWFSVARRLRERGRLYALDLRNHGESPHSDSMTLNDLIDDLKTWINDHQVVRPVLLGHSLGGLVAAAYALQNPDWVQALIVVDIAPKAYHFRHERELAALQIELKDKQNRAEIDTAMSALIPDQGVRQFLQMNIGRSREGFYWKINTRVLAEADVTADMAFLTGTYSGPTLFVDGGASPYINESDHALIDSFFPHAHIVTLPGADHWLHYSAEDLFIESVQNFLVAL